MKLKTKKSEVETFGNIQELAFSIKADDMGLILEILRSKMYSNPIAAICREISTNSRDANREVNHEKIPIRISIDDSFLSPGDLTIAFTDDGPGISPERMADVFVNYGASTKRGTNKQTGGYGLGAKTPFAYSDSFSIVTRVDGTKYTYVAVIEENNSGKIYLMNKEDTTEKNGTSIIVPIQKNDRQVFEQQARQTSFFWDVKPEFIRFQADPENKIKREMYDNVMIIDSSNEGYYNTLFERGFYLLIDEIPYPLNLPALNLRVSHSYSVFFPFKTGQLTISANRESVQYDKPTTEKVSAAVIKFRDSLRSIVQVDIDACSSLFEASIKLNKLQSEKSTLLFRVMNDLNRDQPFKFKNKVITNEIPLQHLMINLIRKNPGYNDKKEKVYKYNENLTVYPIYTVDTGRLNNSRNMTIFSSYSHFYAIEFNHRDLRDFSTLALKKKKTFVKQMRAALAEFELLKEIGFPIQNYSDVARSRRQYDKKIVDKTQMWVRVTSRNNKLSDVKADLTKLDKVVYQVYDPQVNGNDYQAYCAWANFLNRHFAITVHFITKGKEKHYKGKALSLSEKIASLDKTKMQDFSNEAFTNSQYELRQKLELYNKLTFRNGVCLSLKLLLKYYKRNHDGVDLPKDFATLFPVASEVKDAITKVKTVESTYPLISLMSEYSYSTNTATIKEANRYIHLIDQDNEATQGVKV